MFELFFNLSETVTTTLRFFSEDFVVTNNRYISLVEVLITSTLKPGSKFSWDTHFNDAAL